MRSLIIWLIMSVSYSPPIKLTPPVNDGPVIMLPQLPAVVPAKIELPQPAWPKFQIVPPLPEGFGPKSFDIKDLR